MFLSGNGHIDIRYTSQRKSAVYILYLGLNIKAKVYLYIE